MSSQVENQKAVDSVTENKFAVFINPRSNQRYAFNSINNGFTNRTYKEVADGWERHDTCLVTWALWWADFQGFDDITSLIK